MIRLAVRVRSDQAELVLAELLELAPSGVEEVQIAQDVVEYAVYGPPGELPTLPDLKAATGAAVPRRSPMTGLSAGASFTSRSCSAVG